MIAIDPAAAGQITDRFKVGLERAGFLADELALARRVFKAFYREGLNRRQAAEKPAE